MELAEYSTIDTVLYYCNTSNKRLFSSSVSKFGLNMKTAMLKFIWVLHHSRSSAILIEIWMLESMFKLKNKTFKMNNKMKKVFLIFLEDMVFCFQSENAWFFVWSLVYVYVFVDLCLCLCIIELYIQRIIFKKLAASLKHSYD